MKAVTKLWIGLVVLIVLSPVGLILPKFFKSGAAWGEWSTDEIHKFVGYIPRGLEKLSAVWNAPLADYVPKGWESEGLFHLSVGYILSAVVGIIVTVIIMLILGKILAKK